MRTLVKVTFPVHESNEAIKAGTLPETIQSIVAEQKPEAAYFFAENGKRGGFLVIDLKDSSHIPAIAEPWFLALNATVEFTPVMSMEDLMKASSGIQEAVKKYGKVRTAEPAVR